MKSDGRFSTSWKILLKLFQPIYVEEKLAQINVLDLRQIQFNVFDFFAKVWVAKSITYCIKNVALEF